MENVLVPNERFAGLVQQYKADSESVYHTWFINSAERLKAFRSIRRGVEQLVADIKQGRFPNDFRGSSLETILTCITEQKQVFEGAAHAFYWKPKLRIPDIYENEDNKRAFGQLLEVCLTSSREEQLLRAVAQLADKKIKGLGPAVANILYFLHPTLLPPSNTAIIQGFNWLFGRKLKLGCWASYWEMRDTLLAVNHEYRHLLSKDLGALSGLLFEVGTGKIVIEGNSEAALSQELKRASLQKQRRLAIETERRDESLHTEMQYHLIRMGTALGYRVAVAANDRNRDFGGQSFSFHCISKLPHLGLVDDVMATVELIDVLWLHRDSPKVVCAFEVEKSTSIYSGLLRLADLASSLPDEQIKIYLVAPEAREREVIAQLKRPSLLASCRRPVHYLLFGDVSQHCDALCKFGSDHSILDKLAKTV